MDVKDAKSQFISIWAAMGGNWGINKTMAQIHALLLVSPQPITMEEAMEILQISRGNASMNLRSLIDWGLVYRSFVSGDRREFFYAEKDIWKVATQIASERRKRELLPLISSLKELESSKLEGEKQELESFKKTLKDIIEVSAKSDSLLRKAIDYESKWIMKVLKRFI